MLTCVVFQCIYMYRIDKKICCTGVQTTFFRRVKSGNFAHQVNSDIHLKTVEIQMRWLLMSRLIWIFTVCLVNLFFMPQTLKKS